MGSIERVRIVRAHRLDIVVPPTGYDCAGLFQRFPNLLAGCDSDEPVFSQSVRETGGRKQPAVVDEAFVVGVAVLPHPVQGRQFGIACVEARDVISLVVSLDAGQHVRMQGRADVERQVCGTACALRLLCGSTRSNPTDLRNGLGKRSTDGVPAKTDVTAVIGSLSISEP